MSPRSYYFARPDDCLREVFKIKRRKKIRLKDLFQLPWFVEAMNSKLGDLIMTELERILKDKDVGWEAIIEGYKKESKDAKDGKTRLEAIGHLERLVRETEKIEREIRPYGSGMVEAEISGGEVKKELPAKQNLLGAIDLDKLDQEISYQNSLIDFDEQKEEEKNESTSI
jgi:hypothetical protein